MKIRWAISVEETMTSPNFQNIFRKAILCLSETELEYQKKFRFKEDALACLIGKLMPRKAAVLHTNRQWNSLEFVKNKSGKPSLRQDASSVPRFEYNVSHQGDLVVLATGDTRIGVDVMRIDESRRETASEQVDSFKRHFSEDEIESVKGGDKSDLKRWQAFYRIWCLKESILKATGVGLPDGLHNHIFQLDPIYEHIPGSSTTSSLYFHQSIPQPQWTFEESYIGENHCVAVASESPSKEFVPFEMTTLSEMIDEADFVNVTADPDEELDAFMEKPNKPF
ncbi:hypothetical protein L5515_007555 [Caenorhabditis briggsae]|uniref:L-aminoadipate-semialdehyde dehydrogenase-phosphopantetheinyl transferase n=1 Tax=Caenorhabditis briggsae TaxID=6238 RepID=A0AAE9JLD3_CAEBR|nr:hypothetical protein L5515_007555 [Caenorhabditis briggsae]